MRSAILSSVPVGASALQERSCKSQQSRVKYCDAECVAESYQCFEKRAKPFYLNKFSTC